MQYNVIGLMSGSSLDGLDMAFVHFEENAGQWTFEILETYCKPYPLHWKEKLTGKNLKVIVDLPSETSVVRADGTRLEEALHNLLDNAVKFSPDNGQICLRGTRCGSSVVLSVTDNGIGISKEHLPRIFERFYRADKARSRELGGTGLGLAIVKHIAQLHGGRVEAESELGHGITIRIVLPQVPPG